MNALIPVSYTHLDVYKRQASDIAHSIYEIRIRPGIHYQPHPAFALDQDGKPVYADLDPAKLADIETIADFTRTGTRELTADDYICLLYTSRCV